MMVKQFMLFLELRIVSWKLFSTMLEKGQHSGFCQISPNFRVTKFVSFSLQEREAFVRNGYLSSAHFQWL